MPHWLKMLSVASTFVGAVAFCLVMFHSCRVILKDQKYTLLIGSRRDMVLDIIAVPAIYIIMSLRSTCRMWMIMRGVSEDEAEIRTNQSLYKENFELAAICQYFAVFVFTQLCVNLLRDITSKIDHEEAKAKGWGDDMMKAMQLTGFQGAYLWCIFGSLHSVLLFILAYFPHNGYMNLATTSKFLAIKSKISIIASVASLLCTYNMIVICKLKFIRESLGQPSLKFNGTKIMLLLGPNQLKIISALVNTSDNYLLTLPMLRNIVRGLDLSQERSYLVHSSLMCFECLVVVLINLWAWELIPAAKEDADGYHKVPDNA